MGIITKIPRNRPGGANVHIYPSPITNESRMAKICASVEKLGLFDNILILGTWKAGLCKHERVTQVIEILRIQRPRENRANILSKAFKTLVWTLKIPWVLRSRRVTCVNCHSLSALWLCVMLKWQHRSRLVYDTHELETETTSATGIRRPFLKILEKCLIPFVDEVCVVSDSIAAWYQTAYTLGMVEVVRNVPESGIETPGGRLNLLREKFNIPPNDLIFIYQGVLSAGRRINQFLEIFKTASPDRHLVLMGYGPLEAKVREATMVNPNIHFLPAVPPAEVLRHTACADIGLCGVENLCLSYYFSLPNKLFEFIAAGIPALVPDFPEMRKIVAANKCGWVIPDHNEDWVKAIHNVDHHSVRLAKAHTLDAQQKYAWSGEEKHLNRIYERLFPTSFDERKEASELVPG